MDGAVAQAAAEHPDRPVEVWAEDEHRLGLKPIRRRVWAPVGQRPIALGHHRFQWLQVVAFVSAVPMPQRLASCGDVPARIRNNLSVA